MRNIVTLPVIVTFAVACSSSSTAYLECQIASPAGSSRVHLDLTLNEAAGTAGFTIRETKYSVPEVAAAFSPSRVIWLVEHPDMLNLKERYSVDRTTLEITEELSGKGRPFELARKGTCKLVHAAAERKF